jgi:hypothetical protein
VSFHTLTQIQSLTHPARYVAPPGGEMRITISATATISIPGTASLSLLGFSGGRGKERERDHGSEKEKQGDEGATKANDKAEGKEKEAQRPYEVSLVLAIVVRRVEGNVLFKVISCTLWSSHTHHHLHIICFTFPIPSSD